MSNRTIDTAMAKRMVEASAIHGASIIGQTGGWSVMLKLGRIEKPLGTQRGDQPRLWRSLDRCIDYLKSELDIARFELLDATQHSNDGVVSKSRLDTSERMRRAHEAAAHDQWFRTQVQESIDDVRPSIPHEEVERVFAEKRNQLRARIAAEAH